MARHDHASIATTRPQEKRAGDVLQFPSHRRHSEHPPVVEGSVVPAGTTTDQPDHQAHTTRRLRHTVLTRRDGAPRFQLRTAAELRADLRHDITGIHAFLTRPGTQATGAALWGATGGTVARVGRFYLAVDELARSADSRRQADVQRRRLIGTGIGAAVLGPGTWATELIIGGTCDFLTLQYGPWAAVLAAAGYGLHQGHAKLRSLKPPTPEVTGADGHALPIRPLIEARSEGQAMDYLRRALLAEKITAEAVGTKRTSWGWELTVRLLEATPAELRKKLSALEVRLDLGTSKLLAQPHPDRAARVTLRAVQCDPWADMPPLAPYAPTRSIRDRIALAIRLDALDLGISLGGGTHAVVLGASGSGKSILLRAMVDAVAAATDVVLCDLDPSGVGQAPQRAAFSLVALSPEDCTLALHRLVRIAQARTRLLGRHGWDEWQPSTTTPAIAAWIDEFPQLDKEGKALAIVLLRIARKAGISLVFASQSNTKGALGEAISGQVALKAAGAGLQRWELAGLFGETAVADGWDTQALRPKKGSQLNDTGTWLIEGTIEGDQALYSRAHYLSHQHAAARVTAYQQAGGRAVIDDDTLTWAGLTRTEFEVLLTDDDTARAAVTASEGFTPDDGDPDDETATRAALLTALDDDERALLTTAAATYTDTADEWIPAEELVTDIAVARLGWPEGKATTMRVATLLDTAGITKHRKQTTAGKTTVRSRTDLLHAAHLLAS